MAGTIKGITIEIGGNTTKLEKALKSVNSVGADLNKQLKSIDKSLKFNPGNTELLAQKQRTLASAVENTKSKLEQLKSAQDQAKQSLADGNLGQDQFDALTREIIKTENQLKSFEGQAKKTSQTLQEFSQNASNIGESLSNAGSTLTKSITLPLAAAGAASFKFAADFEDAMGATEQVFKDSSGEMKDWAENLKTYYGISKTEALSYANTMGAMLKNIGGLTEQEAAKQSQTLVQLAGDLSAMFGGTTQSAVQALTGALKGNTSMLDNYGMGVNEATIKQKALEMGLSSGTKELSLQAKQAATLALIMEQTGDAQGQAAREANGASGSVKQFTTSLKNLSMSFGEEIIPLFTPVIEGLTGLIQKFSELPSGVKKGIVIFATFAMALGPLLLLLGKLATIIGTVTGAFAIMGGAQVAGASAAMVGLAKIIETLVAGFAIFKGAMTAVIAALTPFAPAISAVIVTLGLLYLAFKNLDKIKETLQNLDGIVTPFFENLKNNINTGWERISENTSQAIENLKTLIAEKWATANVGIDQFTENLVNGLNSGWERLQQNAASSLEKLKGTISTKWDEIKQATSNMVNNLGTSMGAAWDNIKQSAAQKWESIKNAVMQPLKNLLNEFRQFLQSVKQMFSIEIKFPKIKLPKFKINGKFNLNPPSVPNFSVEWHKKGGIFNKPTLLQSSNGALHGVGEAGPEAILPIERLKDMLSDVVGGNSGNTYIFNVKFDEISEISDFIEMAKNQERIDRMGSVT